MCNHSETFDEVYLSDDIVDEKIYIQIVDHFKHLGSFIKRGVADDRDIDARILKAGNAFGSIRNSLLNMHDSVKGSAYEPLITYFLIRCGILVFDQRASLKKFGVSIKDMFSVSVSIERKSQILKQETGQILRKNRRKTVKKTIETLGETCGNTRGNGRKQLGNQENIT